MEPLNINYTFRVRRYLCNSGVEQVKVAIVILSNFQPVRKISYLYYRHCLKKGKKVS
jgi:hypothetical protein